MTAAAIEDIFEKFKGVRSLIVGDVMIDAYLWGKVDRISPEAPVPVILVTERENRLGGAANVALNVASIGANPIICAIAGQDDRGADLKKLLEKRGMTAAGIITSDKRPTTVKTRVISGHQHIVRVDEESQKPLTSEEEIAVMERVEALIDQERPHVIIFEDYNKGLLTPRVIRFIIDLAKKKNIPTAVDPKKENFFAYRGATLFKPNLKELSEGLKIDIDKNDKASLLHAVERLEEKSENEISLITLSERGVFVKSGKELHQIPAHIRDISDVSGAGDTVIGVAALCLALKTDVKFMAALANLAGGLVCEHVGVVPIDAGRLKTEALTHLTELS